MGYKEFLVAEDIAKITNYSLSKSGNIIRALNNELKEKSIHTFKGKVSKKYFCERLNINLDWKERNWKEMKIFYKRGENMASKYNREQIALVWG